MKTRAAVMAALVLCSGRVSAQEESPSGAEVESFVLDFRAPPECPPREDFEALTQGLTPAARFHPLGAEAGADPSTASRRLSITISERKRDYFGTLELVDAQTRATRQFDAETCDEIVEALALATALAIDPNALGGAPSVIEEVPSDAADEPDTEVPPPSPEPNLHLSLGLRSELWWMGLRSRDDSLTPGVSAGSRVAPSVAPMLELDVRALGVWSSLNVSLGYAWSSPTDVELRWAPRLRVGLCPVWWAPVGFLRVAPCLGGSVGRLMASPSSEIPQASDAGRTWGGLDVLARAEGKWRALRVGIYGGAAASLVVVPYELAAPDGLSEELLTLQRGFGPLVGVTLGSELF